MSIASETRQVGELDEVLWRRLLRRLTGEHCLCTPILGPELSYGTIAARAKIAETWAEDLKFPFEERHDLPRVAQYAATMYGGDLAKREFINYFGRVRSPDLEDPEDPYRILARLPIPFYLTTNYDSFLIQAMERNKEKKPRQEFTPWTGAPSVGASAFPVHELHVASPVVFHVYGHIGDPDSLVLTEDDYLNFLGTVANKPEWYVPGPVDRAKKYTLLFLGYRLRDLDFRVLLRFLNLKENIVREKIHFCVQLAEDPGDPAANRALAAVQNFLKMSCDNLCINVYFGTSRQFLSELEKRRKESTRDN